MLVALIVTIENHLEDMKELFPISCLLTLVANTIQSYLTIRNNIYKVFPATEYESCSIFGFPNNVGCLDCHNRKSFRSSEVLQVLSSRIEMQLIPAKILLQ
jgi:hypothetical protein